jgi:5-methyltetrahydrofolate--homocysteine methyltransferase
MVFKKSGVDFLVLETFQDIEELKIAYETLRENTSFFIIPCLTFTYGREYRTLMGQTIEEYVKWALDNKVSIIGSNCGLSSEEMTGLVRIMRELSDLKLWIKPNAGKPQIQEGKIKYQEGIEEFTENCKNMVKNGAKFIGGCCGTTPSYIKKLKEVLINFYPDIKS